MFSIKNTKTINFLLSTTIRRSYFFPFEIWIFTHKKEIHSRQRYIVVSFRDLFTSTRKRSKFTTTRVDQPLTQKTTYRSPSEREIKTQTQQRSIFSKEKEKRRNSKWWKGRPCLCHVYSIATVSTTDGHANWRAETRPGRWFERWLPLEGPPYVCGLTR